MLKSAKNSNFGMMFNKTDTTVASGMVENARNQLDSAKKRVKKSLSWPKNQSDRVDSGKEYSVSDKEYSVTGIFSYW